MTSLPTAFKGLSVAPSNRYSLERDLNHLRILALNVCGWSQPPRASAVHLVEEARAALDVFRWTNGF